jgi:hypothetical protein
MDLPSLDDHDDEQQRDRESPFVQFLRNTRPVFETHVLAKLDPMDRAFFSRASFECHDAAVASGLPRAGASPLLPFKVKDFVESVELLKWAQASGCPNFDARTFALAAGSGSGSLEVMGYLKEHGCPWWGLARCPG